LQILFSGELPESKYSTREGMMRIKGQTSSLYSLDAGVKKTNLLRFNYLLLS
jgi:hypothetical protein